MVKIKFTEHPGATLSELFLNPLGLTPHEFAHKIDVAPFYIVELIAGNADVTADIALRFSQSLGTTPEFWMNLQQSHDLFNAKANSDLSQVQIVNAVKRDERPND